MTALSLRLRKGPAAYLHKPISYRGTRYYNADFVADTKMYCSLQNFILPGYELTKEGYIILTLPADLTPEVYDINGEGIFITVAFQPPIRWSERVV